VSGAFLVYEDKQQRKYSRKMRIDCLKIDAVLKSAKPNGLGFGLQRDEGAKEIQSQCTVLSQTRDSGLVSIMDSFVRE
jgi:hypothetical protein